MAATEHEELRAPRTRTSAAWTLAGVGALVLLLMLVFILQNSHSTEFEFLWMDWSLPIGVALLLSAVIGALIVICLGAGRLLQHRMVERRHRRSGDALTSAGSSSSSATSSPAASSPASSTSSPTYPPASPPSASPGL